LTNIGGFNEENGEIIVNGIYNDIWPLTAAFFFNAVALPNILLRGLPEDTLACGVDEFWR